MVEISDKQMMTNARHWPSLVLPLKRKDNSLENKNLGILINPVPTIYHVYMFGPMNLKTCAKTEYPDFDALIADGWKVD